jgi:Flp pilus assembly protein TadG
MQRAHMRQRTERRRRSDEGAAAVEFALVMVPLIALLLGVIQFGFFFFTTQSASSAAREAARRLTVGECQVGNAAETFARNQANVVGLTLQFGSPNGESDVSTPGTLPAVGAPLRVKVQASADIIHLFPLPSGGTVTRVVDARMEDSEADGVPC